MLFKIILCCLSELAVCKASNLNPKFDVFDGIMRELQYAWDFSSNYRVCLPGLLYVVRCDDDGLALLSGQAKEVGPDAKQ